MTEPEQNPTPPAKKTMNLNEVIAGLKSDSKDLTKLAQNSAAQVIAGVVVIALVVIIYPFVAAKPAPSQGMRPVQQQQAGQKKPQGKTFDIHDEATFKEKAQAYVITPYEDKELQFEVFLPPEWEQEVTLANQRYEGSSAILSEVARIRSPYFGIDRAEVVFQTIKLDHEISAQYWLQNHILSNSYVLEAPVEAVDSKRAHGYFTQIVNNKAIITYILVQINGDIANVARFEIPLAQRDYLGFLQKRSIDSFRNTFFKDRSIEETKVFTMIDALKMNYPVSWQSSAPDLKDVNRPSIQFVNKNATGQTEGYIRVLAVRRGPGKNVLEEIQTLKKDLEGTLNITFKKMLTTEKPKLAERFVFTQTEVYEVETPGSTQSNQEVRLSLLGDSQWYVFVYLLTPTEKANLYAWARNNRTFDLILESLK